jgi:hypothetical protein
VAAQQREPGSLLNFYKTLIRLRNTLPSLARGSFEGSFAQGLVAGWQRKWQGGGHVEHTVVLINYDIRPAAARIEGLRPGAPLVSALPAGGAVATKADAQGVATLLLAPQQVRVLVVDGGRPAQATVKSSQGAKPAQAARSAKPANSAKSAKSAKTAQTSKTTSAQKQPAR